MSGSIIVFLSLSWEVWGSFHQSGFRLTDIPEDLLADTIMTGQGNG